MKRWAWTTFLVAATLAALVVAWEFRAALVLVLVSLAIASGVRTSIDYLLRRGVPRVVAVTATYVLVVAVFSSVLYVAGIALVAEIQQAVGDYATAYERLKEEWPQGSALQRVVADWLPPADELYEAIAGAPPGVILGEIMGLTMSLVALVAQAVIAIVLSLYWSIDRGRFERLWLSLLPAEQRAAAREVGRSVERAVGGTIRSELARSLAAGLLLAPAFHLLGFEYPTTAAVFAALARLIPWVGLLLACLPPAFFSLVSHPLTGLLGVLLVLIVLVGIEMAGHLLGTRRNNPILVALAVIALAHAFGLVGLLIAPPLAAAIQALLVRLPREMGSRAERATSIAELRKRAERLRESVHDMERAPPPDMASLLERLAHVVQRAEQSFPEEAAHQPTGSPS